MINRNVNTLNANLNRPGPVLVTPVNYLLIGGGGGGNGFQPLGNPIGGYGGAGGSIETGSLNIVHGSNLTTVIGAGGNGGPGGDVGTAGGNSTITYFTTITANGGLAGQNTSESTQGGTVIGTPLDTSNNLWAEDGGAGSQTHGSGPNGQGGCTGNSVDWPWIVGPTTPTQQAGIANSGGGGGGGNWQSAGAAGGSGICLISLYDPRDIFTVVSDEDYFLYNTSTGYKYYYYTTDGSFEIQGRKQN